MMKRHEVQVLRRAGVTQEKVAELTGVSVRAVRRIEGEAPVVVPDDDAEREKRGIGRPSKAEPFRGFVAKLLAEDPELLLLEVLRRARLDDDREALRLDMDAYLAHLLYQRSIEVREQGAGFDAPNRQKKGR